ncbi:MAG: recombinase family protein [Selenomonas ruminantium]|nr:recombinase family protein [Selenomonas ruminantium]
MNIGYVRVSTLEQHEERQKIELTEKAKVEKIFLDKLSGKDIDRPQLQAMLEFAREGDTVYVSEFSRLARSTKDLLDIVQRLKEKQVQVISLKESFDTSTPAGELAMTMFAAIATFERKIMLERQKEGIALAKAQGKYRGRREAKKPADWQDLVTKYKCREISTVSELVRICGCSRPTVYKWLKSSGINIKEKPVQLRKNCIAK